MGKGKSKISSLGEHCMSDRIGMDQIGNAKFLKILNKGIAMA